MDAITGLDVETSDGGRVVLEILHSGALSIQCFKDSSHGRPLWALSGAAVVEPEDVREWAATLRERTAREGASCTAN